MFVYRLMIAAIIIFLIQIAVFGIFGHRKIEYRRYFSRKYVFEGEEVTMVEEISNRKLLPVPWLKIESGISENLVFAGGSENLQVRHGTMHESIFSLSAYTKITRSHTVLCSKRGVYSLGNVHMSFGNLLGGGGGRSMEEEAFSVLVVYPGICPVHELPLKNHNVFGEFMMKRWVMKDPFLTAGTNEYTYSEPMNLINWKATARTGAIRVNNLDHSSEHKMMLLLNVDLSEDQWTLPADNATVEKIMRIAASLAYKAVSMGMEVGFATNASCNFNECIDAVRPAAGKTHLHNILTAMAKARSVRKLTFSTFLKNEIAEAKKGYDYLLLSWYDSDKIREAIRILNERGNSAILMTGKEMAFAEKSF